MRSMKNFLSITTLFIIASQSEAATPIGGLYVGGIFGATYQHNINASVSTNSIINQLGSTSSTITSQIPANDSITTTLGYMILINGGGQIGYRFCDNYRLEVEGLYNKNPYNFFRIGDYTLYNNSGETTGYRLEGSTSTGIAFINGYYDFLGDGSNNLVPYVGVGAGYAYIHDVIKLYYNEVLVIPDGNGFRNNNTSAMGQGIVGFSYFMDDFFSVGLDARYYASPKITVTTQSGFSHDVNMQVYSVNAFFNGVLEFG